MEEDTDKKNAVVQRMNIPYDELEFGDEIGEGSFGKVFKGKYHGIILS